jgi:hypothetical protein
MCNALPIESNFYLTAGHLIPEQGDFTIKIVHENSINPTVAKQKMSASNVYRVPNKDLCLLYVPSAIPRRGYLKYLLGRAASVNSSSIKHVSLNIETGAREVQDSYMEPGWSTFSSSINTDKVRLTRPYKYRLHNGTHQGLCGSIVVDYSKAVIYGVHLAGNGTDGLCQFITQEEIVKAMSQFKGFIPANAGELQLGSQSLVKGLGFIECETDTKYDLPVKDHNLVCEGVLEGGSATFKSPFMFHPYYDDVVKEFGKPIFGPPQQVNSDIHKRKALTNLASPNQEFSLEEVEFAMEDYLAPILLRIKNMSSKEKAEMARCLSIQEALDGISEKNLGGIDNSTSVGFPYKGKKKDYLVRDEFDPNIPITPRELIKANGVDMLEEVKQMEQTYQLGQTARPLFKCSMKTNALASIDEVKARVFMGCNFPFLIIARRWLAPVIRMAAQNKFLFETSKGINMDSIECEELYNFLKVEEGERTVALDYSAYDQSMSVQVSSAACNIFVKIMEALGCNSEHIKITRGILTDIIYPNLHFFGTILHLANSDPSGNPITTEINGIVNSLYLRCFFFRIYPNLKSKVTYRSAIKTSTYGDDNINGVPARYEKFNAVNIVEEGKKLGLKITMADKGAQVVPFTPLKDSDFLKRKFRFCPDLGHMRAPLVKTSITKALHWMKNTSPDPPEVLWSQNVDGVLRKSSQYGRDYFEEIKAKMYRISVKHEVVPICKWWDYDELIEWDKKNSYEGYCGVTLHDAPDNDLAVIEQFVSEAQKRAKTTGFKISYISVVCGVLLYALTITAAVEMFDAYKDLGGANGLIHLISEFLRRRKDSWDDLYLDKVTGPFKLNGLDGVMEELNIPTCIRKIISYFAIRYMKEEYSYPYNDQENPDNNYISESYVQNSA